MRKLILAEVLALVVVSLGCSDDAPNSSDDEVGDGDGDPGTGDGDGDPGDGDGDPGDGDGDGDPGDGDGDGDPGDGDGDGDDSPSLPPDFLDQLTKVGGCGDVYIGATNPEGTVGIFFNGTEIAITAHELAATQVRESVLPSEDVELRIALGTFLDQGCNDTGDGPQITSMWTAVSGTVILTVVPMGMQEPWQVPADATLELVDVTFEGVGLDPVVIDSWIVEDVSVGWFPG